MKTSLLYDFLPHQKWYNQDFRLAFALFCY